MSTVAEILDLLAERPARLGVGRLLCIDGPAGSGKSTLSEAVVQGFDERGFDKLNHRRVVHMDDLYEGWDGLSGVDRQLDAVLRPLAAGRAGRYRRYDWLEAAWAETVEVQPCSLLLIEGVGSGAARFDDLRSLLVWVEASYDERMRRGLRRDGEAFAPHWDQWAQDEARLFAREDTRARADVVVDGTLPYDASSALSS